MLKYQVPFGLYFILNFNASEKTARKIKYISIKEYIIGVTDLTFTMKGKIDQRFI